MCPYLTRRLWYLSHIWYHCQLGSWFQQCSNCFVIPTSLGHKYQANGRRCTLRERLRKLLTLFSVPRLQDPLSSKWQVQGRKLTQTQAGGCDMLSWLPLSLLVTSRFHLVVFSPTLMTLQMPYCFHHLQNSFWSGPADCDSNHILKWMLCSFKIRSIKP